MIGGGGSSIDEDADNFMGMFVNAGSTTESVVQTFIANAGTLSNFYVHIQPAPGSSPNSWTFFVRKNGVNTSVTCAITVSTATSCSDLTNSVSFVAGDLISILADPNSSPNNISLIIWTAKYQ